MVYVEFKSVKAAQKYNPSATTARQTYANTHISRKVRRVGRHVYIQLYNTVTKQYTNVYADDVRAHWTG